MSNTTALPSTAPGSTPGPLPAGTPGRPLALVVFLENVGHIVGLRLPRWAMEVVDFATEEYAKLLLRLHGAYRRYDRVVILEDERATGRELAHALQETSRTHRVDLLLLVHGHAGCLVGYRDRERVDAGTLSSLLQADGQNPAPLDLRMVFGLNCYGATLAPLWIDLGAQIANGSVGVNWFPEPTLSVFLHNWLGGRPFSEAVGRSYRLIARLGRRLRPLDSRGLLRAAIDSSRPIVYGRRDLTIDSIGLQKSSSICTGVKRET